MPLDNGQIQQEADTGKVLLIGVTGGTGGNVVKGFLEQGVTSLCAITRKIDLNRPSLSKMRDAGVELVDIVWFISANLLIVSNIPDNSCEVGDLFFSSSY